MACESRIARLALVVCGIGIGVMPMSTVHADVEDKVSAAVNVGDTVPTFESTDEFGRTWKSNQHIRRRIVVLFFYPGDFTPLCSQQAEDFQANLAALVAKGIKVVGVSGDMPATHQLFKESHHLNFTLLCDPEGSLASSFGVPVSGGAKVRARTAGGQPLRDADGKSIVVKRPVTLDRWTLILDLDGKVAYKNTKSDPVKCSEEILRVVEELEKKSK